MPGWDFDSMELKNSTSRGISLGLQNIPRVLHRQKFGLNFTWWLWIMCVGLSCSPSQPSTAGISRMWHLPNSGKAWGLAGFSLTKSFTAFASNQPELGDVPSALKRHLSEVFVGEQLPLVMKGKGKWLRLEGSGCSQCYWCFGCFPGCQELRLWLLLSPTCVILSQVAAWAELTQCCRADPKDLVVCGKAPRNFTPAWSCSLDLPAAHQLVLTFGVVSNHTRSSQALRARVCVLAQLAIAARIFICLGPSADRGSAEQTRCVLHSAPETGRKSSGETCYIF